MPSLNLFIVIIALSCLYLNAEFSYLVALLCSLAAATFIYSGEGLNNILLVMAIFTLTPLVSHHYKWTLQRPQSTLEEEKGTLQATLEKMVKERKLLEVSSQQLNIEISQIGELYKITKDMSAVLEFEELFSILTKKFVENFQFKRCRMILLDEKTEPLQVKLVFKYEYGEDRPALADKDVQDELYLEQSQRMQKVVYLEQQTLVLAPLEVDGKFLGAVSVEDLPSGSIDNFSILFNQFCLEFRRVKLYQKIQELAITDSLTGLFTRRYFMERLSEELQRSARHSLQLCFLMIDIDNFKQCNDNFGHLTGDVVLKEVAARIKSSVREIDLIGRFGGEEFSVLLPDTDKPGAKFVAERICSSIAEHRFRAYDETIKTAVSIGLAAFPADATQLQQLIDRSDQALYRAKEQGKNRVCLA